MNEVLLERLAEDDHIIDDTTAKLVRRAQGGVHQPLEESRSVFESERHDDPLVKSFGTPKGRFATVLFIVCDLVFPHLKSRVVNHVAPAC